MTILARHPWQAPRLTREVARRLYDHMGVYADFDVPHVCAIPKPVEPHLGMIDGETFEYVCHGSHHVMPRSERTRRRPRK